MRGNIAHKGIHGQQHRLGYDTELLSAIVDTVLRELVGFDYEGILDPYLNGRVQPPNKPHKS